MGWGQISDCTGAIGVMARTGAPCPAISAAVAVVVGVGIGAALTPGAMVTPPTPVPAAHTVVTALIGHHFRTCAPGMMRYDMIIPVYRNVSVAGGLLALAAGGPGRRALTRRTPRRMTA